MNRDALKTLGAIILIAGIVGATFWYGNRQRQQQVKQDQATKQQTAQQAPSPTPAATPAPSGQTPNSNVSMPAKTPATGGSLAIVVPVGALVAVAATKRYSDKALKRSLQAS